jgi:hypothetical protein
MNGGEILNLLYVTVLPPLVSAGWMQVFRMYRRRPWNFYAGWISSALPGGFIFLIFGPRAWAAGSAANISLAAFLWWLSRRRRKRAPRSYGAKSRALIAAMVARMRESLRPRPVLRPAPVPSRLR